MSEKKEITKIIERLELLEEKFGITISGLYATCEYLPYRPCHQIKINFDVTSLNGGRLSQDVYITASVYNLAGQLLNTVPTCLRVKSFIGFSSESLPLDCDQEPARIRLVPSVLGI